MPEGRSTAWGAFRTRMHGYEGRYPLESITRKPIEPHGGESLPKEIEEQHLAVRLWNWWHLLY